MVLGLPLLIAVTVPFRDSVALSTELLLVLSLVLAIAAIGGKVVAAVAAIVGSLLVNWFYVVPYNTLTISEVENLVALVVFIGVAVTVGTLVDVASKRSIDARRARLEAEALARSTTSLAADPEPLPRLLDQLHTTFNLSGVQILRAEPDGVVTVASAGDDDTGSPTASMRPRLDGAGWPSATDHSAGLRTVTVDRRSPAAADPGRPAWLSRSTTDG